MKLQTLTQQLLLCVLAVIPATAQNVTSHTFFSVRPEFQSGSPELFTLFHDRMMAVDCCDCHGGFQVVVFGGSTQNNKDCANPLALYFLPFNKSTITAGEYNSEAVHNNTVDVVANYFGVLTADPLAGAPGEYNILDLTFQSQFTIDPRRTVTGVGLHYKQKLTPADTRSFWVSASTPIMHVKHELRFTEKIINEGGGDVQPGYVNSIGAALRGQTVFGDQLFKYGKIANNSCNTLYKSGLADIELKLGYIFEHTHDCYIEGYGGIVVPTGNKPCGEFLFEPIVGNNHHFGFIFGGEGSVELICSQECDGFVSLAGALDFRYLLSNTQIRSFDLVDKQWSRYIFLYPNDQAVSLDDITPGINLLTKPLTISPRNWVTANLELIFERGGWATELGFNLFARQAEKAELACRWQEGPGIVGIDTNDAAVLHTKRVASMPIYIPASSFVGVDTNPTYIPIKETELNLQSAAHPACLSHTIYGAMGYRTTACDCPWFLGIGASYEFSADNTALTRWLAWGKGGVSF